MAISFVASGATATASVTSTISPAFGATTTAGNTLIAFTASFGAASISTTASGWSSFASGGTSTSIQIALWAKFNCSASETAPVFTSASATYLIAGLVEFSGTATAVDKHDVSPSGISTNMSDTNPQPDSSATDLVIFGGACVLTKSATVTLAASLSPVTGTVNTIFSDLSTKLPDHGFFSYVVGTGGGGGTADTATQNLTLSSGAMSTNTSFIASIAPMVQILPPRQKPSTVGLFRAAHW